MFSMTSVHFLMRRYPSCAHQPDIGKATWQRLAMHVRIQGTTSQRDFPERHLGQVKTRQRNLQCALQQAAQRGAAVACGTAGEGRR